jgi:beta-galactosidase
MNNQSRAVVLALLALATPLIADDWSWYEAEQPVTSNFAWGIERHPLASAGARLQYIAPADAARRAPQQCLLDYAVATPNDGAYTLWLRLAYEHSRAPLTWRIGTGAWQQLSADVPTTSLMELGTWNSLAWALCGTVTLARGEHTLTMQFGAPGADGRVLVGLDCFALMPLAMPFTPEGALKPGQHYDQPMDTAAAATIFSVPAEAAPRARIALTGLWQAARWDDPTMDAAPYAPITTMPAASEYPLQWLGLPVPGNAFALRPELALGHRFFYRTKVYVPPQTAPRAYRLHCAGSTWIAGVLVNGAFAGAHTSVLVPWDMDITPQIIPGATNELVIGIKSPWYAIDVSDARGRFARLQQTRVMPSDGAASRYFTFVDAIYPSSKGDGDGLQVGLVNPLFLQMSGPVCVDDVIVRTSVTGQHIIADVTVRNTLSAPTRATVQCEAIHERSGGIEQLLGPVSVLVPAAGAAHVSITTAWANAKLWWPERNPNVYVLRTLARINNDVSDARRTTFGFREVTLDGKHLRLNGIPWHFWNWVDVGRVANENEWLARYEAQYDRFHRISEDHSRIFGYREVALEKLDRLGIAGRLSTCIDGMFITHNLYNPLTWSNFARHIRQVVTTYRNHPSILMWSIGNELMLVTGRLRYGREYRRWEEATAQLCALANELDPTRPSFEDGAGDLGGLSQMNCDHYGWQTGGTFPRCAYAYDTGPTIEPRPVNDRFALYRWSGQNPYLFGEVFHYHAASDMSWFGGPRTYRGVAERDRAAARYYRIALEGARWQDVTAVCPWTLALPDALKSCMPIAAFMREHNALFYAGTSGVQRTIGVFNDTRTPRMFTLAWETLLDGKSDVGGSESGIVVSPGTHQRMSIGLAFPRVLRRTPVTLRVALQEGTNLVFEDTRQFAVIPPPAPIAAPANALCVVAPMSALAPVAATSVNVGAAAVLLGIPPWRGPRSAAGSSAGTALTPWLDRYVGVYTTVSATEEIPAAARVVLVAPHVLTPQNTRMLATRLAAAAACGATVIVLEQDTPLQGADLPVPGIVLAEPRTVASREMAEFAVDRDYNGAIAHPIAPGHPVFADLTADDFFAWGSETLFKKSYVTPATGALPLLQAGPALGLAPLLEVPVGTGVYLLSQVLIGAHLDVEPAADYLLANALRWALERGAHAPMPVTLAGDDGALRAWLASTGVRLHSVPDARAALAAAPGIACVRATPAALAVLTQEAARVQQFCAAGGWLVLLSLEPDGLEAFNALVGRTHRLRRFGAERVVLDDQTTPLAVGITDRDCAQFSDEMLAPWMKLYRRSPRVFTHVVDSTDVAAFAPDADPRLTDGLDNREFWQYVVYYALDPASRDDDPRLSGRPVRLDFTLAAPATFSNVVVTINTTYQIVKDLKIMFDDNEDSGIVVTCMAHDRPQSFAFAPRAARKISLKVLSCYPDTGAKKLIGFDDVALPCVPAPAAAPAIFLTQPAGVVVYPRGAGGIVLANLDYAETPAAATQHGESQAQLNATKKRAMMAKLLRNMGAAFQAAPPAGR